MAREAHSPHRGGFVNQGLSGTQRVRIHTKKKLFAQPLRAHRGPESGRPNSLRPHTKIDKGTHHSSPTSDKGSRSVRDR